MSSLQISNGTAEVTLHATFDRTKQGSTGVQPVYVGDDLLAATAAALRAASDPRADAVQTLVPR